MAQEGLTRSWRCGPGPFQKVLEELRQLGGRIEGGDSAGTLGADTPLGLLEGRYTFDGEELTVTLTRKPALLPVQMIWNRIDGICGPGVMKA